MTWTQITKDKYELTLKHTKLTVKKIKGFETAYKYEIRPVNEDSSGYMDDGNAFVAKSMKRAQELALEYLTENMNQIRTELQEDQELLDSQTLEEQTA